MKGRGGAAAAARRKRMLIIGRSPRRSSSRIDKHIVHGDLKPGNVIVTYAGAVKVIDFGIARFLRRPQEADEPPASGEREFSALTPPYAARRCTTAPSRIRATTSTRSPASRTSC